MHELGSTTSSQEHDYLYNVATFGQDYPYQLPVEQPFFVGHFADLNDTIKTL